MFVCEFHFGIRSVSSRRQNQRFRTQVYTHVGHDGGMVSRSKFFLLGGRWNRDN